MEIAVVMVIVKGNCLEGDAAILAASTLVNGISETKSGTSGK